MKFVVIYTLTVITGKPGVYAGQGMSHYKWVRNAYQAQKLKQKDVIFIFHPAVWMSLTRSVTTRTDRSIGEEPFPRSYFHVVYTEVIFEVDVYLAF